MFMDAGEGAYQQVIRKFGHAGAREKMKSLKTIWISHLHADHHLGLVTLLKVSYELGVVPLVIAPKAVVYWLLKFFRAGVDSIRFEYTVISNMSIATEEICARLCLDSFVNVPVEHCMDAFGLVMSHKSGWKIVYSGDTRPCPRLVEEGKGATILIHEATFSDEMPEDAIKRSHCTTGEALRVGDEMSAGLVVLTHFSQRYPKLSQFTEHVSKFVSAFDMMTIFPGIDKARLQKVRLESEKLLKETEEDDNDEGIGHQVFTDA
jgi:ribonuclease Z